MIRDDYAGAGGWSEGLRMLGLTDVGIEWDADACRTRTTNGHRTIRADLATYRPAGKPTGYIASPPCQTFSTAGNGDGRAVLDGLIAAVHAQEWETADRHDDKTRHVIDAARVAATCGAEWIAMEQVPAVLPIWVALAHVLDGYSTWTGVLNAADYSVPQTRRRAILIASRTRRVGCPQPTHDERPTADLFGPALKPWISWGEALGVGGTVELETVRGAGMTARHGARPARPNTEPSPTIRAGLSGIGTGLRMTIDRRQGAMSHGERVAVRDVPSDEPAPTFGTKSGGQWQMSPAATIGCDPRISPRTHHETGDQGRDARTVDQIVAGDYDGTQPIRLTTAQAATLQSFRPDMAWTGTKTSVFRQIGNAIPPLLAARIVAEATGRSFR